MVCLGLEPGAAGWKAPLTFKTLSTKKMGSGCGAVGRAVASDARDRQVESSHRQFFLLSTLLFKTVSIEKTKIKKKEGRLFGKTQYFEPDYKRP